MSEYTTIRHKCGRLFNIRWITTSTPEFQKIVFYQGCMIPTEIVTKCECGSELIPFKNKEWSEQ